MRDSTIQIILAALAFLTGAVAWYAKVKIAETKRKQPKQPSEVLFEGYERLLKRYQDAIAERDDKVRLLEQTVDHAQAELNKALGLIAEMKGENISKDTIIRNLEGQLLALRDTIKPVVEVIKNNK